MHHGEVWRPAGEVLYEDMVYRLNFTLTDHARSESVMKVTYDQELDILRIVLNDAEIEESDEDKPGVIIDYDDHGNVIGLEILDASTRIANPRTLEYAVTG